MVGVASEASRMLRELYTGEVKDAAINYAFAESYLSFFVQVLLAFYRAFLYAPSRVNKKYSHSIRGDI